MHHSEPSGYAQKEGNTMLNLMLTFTMREREGVTSNEEEGTPKVEQDAVMMMVRSMVMEHC